MVKARLLEMAPIQPPSARPMPVSTEQYGLVEEEYADRPVGVSQQCCNNN
jgi:hypothetical protein